MYQDTMLLKKENNVFEVSLDGDEWTLDIMSKVYELYYSKKKYTPKSLYAMYINK